MRVAHIGMATNLYERLRSRFAATRSSRFGQDCIPWLHDLMRSDPQAHVELIAILFGSRPEAIDEERNLRRRLRADGWTVTSDA